jgi:hypothetical protein
MGVINYTCAVFYIAYIYIHYLINQNISWRELSFAQQFDILSFQNFKISGKNSKKINGYKISNNSPSFATLQ